MNKKIYELAELIDKDLENSSMSEAERNNLEKEMRKYLPENAIVLAQANPISGNVKYNAQKALRWIKWANRLAVKAIIFPELFLIGYPIGDFIDRFPVIVEENIEWLNALAKFTTDTKVIIGFVNFNNGKFK